MKNKKDKPINSEDELVDSLSCDELCVISTKKKRKDVKEIAEDKMIDKGCSCSLNK